MQIAACVGIGEGVHPVTPDSFDFFESVFKTECSVMWKNVCETEIL